MTATKDYWHYTTGYCLAMIRASKLLLPATDGVPAHEKPIVWLSSRASWEPTATKGLINTETGERTEATLQQMHDMSEGIYRLRVEGVEIIEWPTLGIAAFLSKKMRAGLDLSAVAAGADPSDWAGCLNPVPLENIVAIEQIDPATSHIVAGVQT